MGRGYIEWTRLIYHRKPQVSCRMSLKGHSMLSVAFVQTMNLGDTFWISEIRFQYPGSSSEDNKAIDYIFGICRFHVLLSTCYEF